MVGVEEYADALESNGYTIHEVVAEQVNAKLGHVIVTDTLQIDGEQFEARPMLNLYAEQTEGKGHPVAVHGIDVHSRPGQSFSGARESLLDEHATTRDQMGDDWVTWTYHSREQDDVDDNVADLRAAYRDVFDDLAGEITSVSPL